MSGFIKNSKLPPSALFAVPPQIDHLSEEQAKALEKKFEQWFCMANKPNSISSRKRLQMLFLLIRYTGARLGEILDIRTREDLDLDRCTITLNRAKNPRQVPIPDVLCKLLKAWIWQWPPTDPQDRLFKIDPGYIRKIFYARAQDCKIKKSLASPRSLRNTRAVELLRSGVPLAVVRDMLGHSSTDLTSVYQHYSDGDVSAIMRKLALKKSARNSARNTFYGHVAAITRDSIMTHVSLQTETGLQIDALITSESAFNLKIECGIPIAASVKAPLMNIYRKEEKIRGSSVNRISAETVSVRNTKVLSEITARTKDGTILCALLTRQSSEELDLKQGDEVQFRFKALSVILTGC